MPARINKVQLERSIRQIAAERVNRVLPALKDRIEQDIDEEILRGMNQSPTVASLTGPAPGDLRQELGLTDSEGKVAELITDTQEIVTVDARQLRGGVRARQPILRISVNQGNLRNLANRDYAFQANSPRFRPELLPWLRWLLIDGRRQIIRNSRILRGRVGQGRNAGGSIMSRNDPGGSWAVPPEHSGTITNNFITRVFDSIAQRVQDRVNRRLNASIPRIRRG